MKEINVHLQWASLASELVVYSTVTSIIIFLITLLLFLCIRLIVKIQVTTTFLVVLLAGCIGGGISAYILGVLSSLSRETGNPALIGAVLPLLGGLALYLKKGSTSLMIALLVVYIVAVINMFGGVYMGSSLRFKVTEIFQALQEKAIVQHKLEIFKNNLEELDPFLSD